MKMRNLMLGGAMALTLAGCSSGPETPEEVAKSFFEALAHNDLEKAEDLSTGMISVGLEQARKSGDLPSEQKAPKDFSVKVVKSYTVWRLPIFSGHASNAPGLGGNRGNCGGGLGRLPRSHG